MVKKKKVFLLLLAGVLVIGVSVVAVILNVSNDDGLAVDNKGRTVVERYGNLQVVGTNLCNEKGKPIQLRGMSSHGLQWHGKYANEDVLTWLRDDWNVQLWRAAMYLLEGGYITSPVLKQKVIDSVEAALNLGIYVIIDWHVHNDRDPGRFQEESLVFFAEMAQRYGKYPNVIYEICNEPNGDTVTWSESIKPYAEAVIAEIRRYDPDNIIIVGTPTWSQDVDSAAMDPITEWNNIMYTLHFYAGSHGDELRKKADFALEKGLPLFVTEWGTSLSNGGGDYFREESLEWLSYMKKKESFLGKLVCE